MTQKDRRYSPLVVGLVLLGVVSRLIPHPWNATPLTAIALFGGVYLSKRWSLIVPLAIVAASDLLLGWHSTVPFTWGAFAATGLLGWWLRSRPNPARIAGGSLAGSTLFFIVTNFGVWATQMLYPKTAAGLWECYVAALPFFRNSLVGDLGYTAALFGMYALAGSWRLAPVSARAE